VRIDPEVVRDILLRIEEAEPVKSATRGHTIAEKLEENDPAIIWEHIIAMEQAGVLSCEGRLNGVATLGRVRQTLSKVRLTMAGQAFLDTVRDQSKWDKLKASAAKLGGGITFAVLKEAAVKLITEGIKAP